MSLRQCLSRLPHDDALTPSVDPSVSQIPPVNTSGSYWDDIVYMHMDLNTRVSAHARPCGAVCRHDLTCKLQIHNTGLFFPWHRFYVQAVETAMKERCGYTGAFPYWDWSIGPSFLCLPPPCAHPS